MVKAEQWGLNTMRQTGADKSWLQECMVPHWVRGGKEELRVTNGAEKNHQLAVAALGNSTGTGPKGINAPVIEIKSFDDLEANKDKINGKIVFYNYKFNPRFVRTFEAYGDAVIYRYIGPARAAKYGAVAVLVRSMSHSVDNYPHTGSTASGDTIPKIPSMAIGLRDADWLSDQLQKTTVNVFYKSNAHFLPDTIGHSVIGELTGSEFPNEFITIGGHLDSWDLAEGANDDGAGVVRRWAGTPLGSTAARTGRGFASPAGAVTRVPRRRKDRPPGDGAADAEDVRARARLGCERDATRLSRNAAVGTNERPLNRCRTARASGTRGPSRAGDTRRAGGSTRKLAGPEVACEQRVILHLHGCDAVSRQPGRRVRATAQHEQQGEACDHHRRRGHQSLEPAH